MDAHAGVPSGGIWNCETSDQDFYCLTSRSTSLSKSIGIPDEFLLSIALIHDSTLKHVGPRTCVGSYSTVDTGFGRKHAAVGPTNWREGARRRCPRGGACGRSGASRHDWQSASLAVDLCTADETASGQRLCGVQRVEVCSAMAARCSPALARAVPAAWRAQMSNHSDRWGGLRQHV